MSPIHSREKKWKPGRMQPTDVANRPHSATSGERNQSVWFPGFLSTVATGRIRPICLISPIGQMGQIGPIVADDDFTVACRSASVGGPLVLR
jgi:hypothetical protein